MWTGLVSRVGAVEEKLPVCFQDCDRLEGGDRKAANSYLTFTLVSTILLCSGLRLLSA